MTCGGGRDEKQEGALSHGRRISRIFAPMRAFILMCLAGAVACAPAATTGRHAATGEWIPLFNGRDLWGWTPKIAKHEMGMNYARTFRAEDGLLKVRYDG